MSTAPIAPESLWTVKDVAGYLKVSTSWVYMHAEDGTLPSVRIGSLRRFLPDTIRAYARGEWQGTAVVSFPKRLR
jgi:excisionase family DNA binding protein